MHIYNIFFGKEAWVVWKALLTEFYDKANVVQGVSYGGRVSDCNVPP